MKYTGIVLHGSGSGDGASAKFDFNNRFRCREVLNIIGIIPFPGTLNIRLHNNFDFLGHQKQQGDILRIKGFIGGHSWKFNPELKEFLNYSFPNDYELQSCSFFKCRLNNLIDVWLMRFDIDMYDRNFVELISKDCLRQQYNIKNNDTITLEID